MGVVTMKAVTDLLARLDAGTRHQTTSPVGNLLRHFYEVAVFSEGRFVSSLDNKDYVDKVEQMTQKYGSPKVEKMLFTQEITPYGTFPRTCRRV